MQYVQRVPMSADIDRPAFAAIYRGLKVTAQDNGQGQSSGTPAMTECGIQTLANIQMPLVLGLGISVIHV